MFIDDDPADPSSEAIRALSEIEKPLSDIEKFLSDIDAERAPRKRGRPTVNHYALIELVRQTGPFYVERTGREPAAPKEPDGGAGGPFVRLMTALTALAGAEATPHAIRVATLQYENK